MSAHEIPAFRRPATARSNSKAIVMWLRCWRAGSGCVLDVQAREVARRMMEERQFHPIAETFPLMGGEDFEQFAEDIRANGLREPIWLHQGGRIIDGRNRYRACVQVGVEPRFQTWDGQGSLVSFVLSLNLHRRHLGSSQRAAIAAEILPLLEAEAKERQGTRTDIGQKIDRSFRASEEAARLLNTNRQYVTDARKLRDEDPQAFEELKTGRRNLIAIKREKTEAAREARRQENTELVKAAPDPIAVGAKFATIVADPPWYFGAEEGFESVGNVYGRGAPDYHMMRIEEICALPAATLADEDCHLYLWIANSSLPKGFQVLRAWGFRYVTTLTWVKPHFGMGMYFRSQTEHVLFGVKGSQPLKRKDAGTVFHAPPAKNIHSSKPIEFYDLVESCSPGPYLEMFARSEREGWGSWGAEVCRDFQEISA